ncbi:hypothetical protein [Sphingobacterium sp. SYP-B4668]|uniref:hypothetical protein n=1 Tax=Sphingobacterium sp. SYP-B4668 TaxID=2996035 RepID=UPI0022DDAEAF|nr:hypothetical protein [Sphingobacterium sp. SYP-B4668]
MYIGTEPSLIFLSFDYKNEVFEIYDLTFRGDAYLLKEKYGTVHFKSAKAGIESIRLRGGISSWLNITEAAVYRDSVSFSFSLIDEFKMDASDWAVGSQAHYKSSIMPLGERIVNRLKQVKRLGAVDSVLVYQGTMTKYGYLKDLALVFGKQSTFSDVVAEELLGKETRNETDNTQADWNPAFVDRGKLDVMFRIFVKLEPDGSVTVENAKKLRSFIGR